MDRHVRAKRVVHGLTFLRGNAIDSGEEIEEMNRSRLLLIERDCALRYMIEDHLRRLEAFEVEVVEEADIGVERARLGRYDLVLASLHVKDMSSSRLLSALSSVRPLPVIIVVGRPERIDGLGSKQTNQIWEALRVPFSRSELAEVTLRARRHSQNTLCRTVVPPPKKSKQRKGAKTTQRRKSGGRPVRLGHYEVSELIGGGAKGTVYRGVDKRNEETVALRAIPREIVERLGAGTRWFERFTREASTAASINHPNLSAILDHGFEDDQRCLFVVSEFVEGTRLADRLKKEPLSPAGAIEMACHAANGLAAVHAGGFAHRLVRPSNIVLDDRNRAIITDLGVAPMLAWDLIPLRQRLNQTPYLSPEQVRFGRVDDRSDQFSLGLILFKALAGRHCFKGKSPSGMIHEMMKGPVKLTFPKGMKERSMFSELLSRMLAQEPEERFQGDIELKAALGSCAEDLGVSI